MGPLISIIYLIFALNEGFWVNHLVYFCGIPTLILTFLFYAFESNKKNSYVYEMDNENNENLQKVNYFNLLFKKLKLIVQNK